MAYLLALLMAAASFLLNRELLRRFGSHVVISLSPVLEESVKTLSAYYFQADLIMVHIGFGVIEAAYDWYSSQETAWKAAILSIVGHTFFGAVTAFCWRLAGIIWLGLAAGCIVHLLWNVIILRWFATR
ncbi:hypothetical protein [Acetonema longum]|uniref:Uncharacterized protein n=1 Tax=Acetonema longum DSM 6540 TaxID=1009370 RepID=F7NH87_9FIRM|nr:hypothetical protein [Acetonema longum]EGO64570.1 hypothetical protein ALO_07163 [Acetonema longum DSM 6540]